MTLGSSVVAFVGPPERASSSAKATAATAPRTTPAAPAAARGTVMVAMASEGKAATAFIAASARVEGGWIDLRRVVSGGLLAPCLFAGFRSSLWGSTLRLLSVGTRSVRRKEWMLVQVLDKVPERMRRWVEMV